MNEVESFDQLKVPDVRSAINGSYQTQGIELMTDGLSDFGRRVSIGDPDQRGMSDIASSRLS